MSVTTLSLDTVAGGQWDYLKEFINAQPPSTYMAIGYMRDNITQADVANCAAFLAGDGAKMITGQTIFVDAGYSIVGVPQLG